MLTLITLLALASLVFYSFRKYTNRGPIDNKPQAVQKPLPTPKRAAKPPLPPPLQQTKSSKHQKTSSVDITTEHREAEPFQSELPIQGSRLQSDSFQVEKPGSTDPPSSLEIGKKFAPKAGTPIPPVPTKDEVDNPVSIAAAHTDQPVTYRVPKAPKNYERSLWVPCGEPVTIKNTTIPGGMIYVGNNLKCDSGINDPCLIDPSKPVAQHGDYTERHMDYWPSYSEISATARRAYLNWLSDGRKDPAADIGFVFLFFYGLERRSIVDSLSDESAQADLPIIALELRRLLSIYGSRSSSFNGYASEFLDWITLPSYPSRLYEQPLPALSRSSRLPLHLRLALGQAAMDGKPVPPSIALCWAKLEQNIILRTPATRCPEEFNQLFLQKYPELMNQGIILPRNKTKLKVEYFPASAGFRTGDPLIKVLDDIPDITVLTAPIKKLEKVVEAATKDLEPFSRLIAKNPAARDTCEGLLRLPTSLWPEISQKRLLELKKDVGEGIKTMKYEDTLYSLFGEAKVCKNSILYLARILESICVGIEPNVNLGAKLPNPDDLIVLFAMPCSEVPTRTDGPFLIAELTLQLASAVAAADGDFSLGEAAYLREQVNSWRHLTQGQKYRLLAHIEFLTHAPASLTSLKKKIEKFNISDREMIAESMARIAHVDGSVSPEAIKVLEKIYKALGISTSKMFSHLHVAASGSEKTKPEITGTARQESRFSLNRDRIAARQADTEKVQALLANIFRESDEPGAEKAQITPPPGPPPVGATYGSLLGLDEPHSTLARRMLDRQEWSREELIQIASELDLMLDGALEYINEATLDTFDIVFTEGDDPIALNPELLGMLSK